jgi:hypothetical protein
MAIRRTKKQKLLYYTNPRFYNKLFAELETTEERVCWLLAKDEHLRNCDNCLLFKFWREVDDWDGLTLRQSIHKLTPAEDITRCRRRIQNTYHLWPPTDQEVISKRRIKEEVIKEWITTSNSFAIREDIYYGQFP